MESRLCVSSDLGKKYEAALHNFSISIYAKRHCCYLRYLIYILTEIKSLMSMVVKLVSIAVISFHCDRDERRPCQFQCTVYG